jgi:hypothetical protein
MVQSPCDQVSLESTSVPLWLPLDASPFLL